MYHLYLSFSLVSWSIVEICSDFLAHMKRCYPSHSRLQKISPLIHFQPALFANQPVCFSKISSHALNTPQLVHAIHCPYMRSVERPM